MTKFLFAHIGHKKGRRALHHRSKLRHHVDGRTAGRLCRALLEPRYHDPGRRPYSQNRADFQRRRTVFSRERLGLIITENY